MWERFTERAKHVVHAAREEATRLGSEYVRTEHILLGLCREPDGIAARALDNLGVDVESLAGMEIHSVFIGSCTNGTYEDIAKVSAMMKGSRIKEGIVATLVPATMKVYKRLLSEGHINTLIDSGFVGSNPGCGGCASGQIGMTGEGQVHVSTSNRNFAGKQGAGDTYLASPETAAASAILGRIATEEEVA